MSRRNVTRVGGALLLIVSVVLAGCGGADNAKTTSPVQQSISVSTTVSPNTSQTRTAPLTPASPGDESSAISYTAISVEFDSSNRYGIFREAALKEPITRTSHATILTRSAYRSQIAFGRIASTMDDSQNVTAFINQTDFEHQALFVVSRRFGGAGGEYTITTMQKLNASTWQIRTVRRPGPLQAESTGVLIIRINQTAHNLPEQLRIIYHYGDEAPRNRTVSLT